MKRLDPAIVKQQIDQLLLAFPELAHDEMFRIDVLEGQTDFKECLRELERSREDDAGDILKLKTSIENKKERLGRIERREQAKRLAMFNLMQWADLTKMELPEATLSVRQGSPKVVITDEQLIPDEFIRIKREPDKVLLKTALSDGEIIEGVALSNAEPTLAVRVK